MSILNLYDKSSSSESVDVYSTEEKRIGTWIDGKPLYRKVCQFNDLNTSNYVAMAQVPLNVDYNLINFYGVTWRDSARTKWAGAFPYLAQNYWSSGPWIITITKAVADAYFIMAQGNSDNAINKTLTFSFDVVVEYTKTTDSTNE